MKRPNSQAFRVPFNFWRELALTPAVEDTPPISRTLRSVCARFQGERESLGTWLSMPNPPHEPLSLEL